MEQITRFDKDSSEYVVITPEMEQYYYKVKSCISEDKKNIFNSWCSIVESLITMQECKLYLVPGYDSMGEYLVKELKVDEEIWFNRIKVYKELQPNKLPGAIPFNKLFILLDCPRDIRDKFLITTPKNETEQETQSEQITHIDQTSRAALAKEVHKAKSGANTRKTAAAINKKDDNVTRDNLPNHLGDMLALDKGEMKHQASEDVRQNKVRAEIMEQVEEIKHSFEKIKSLLVAKDKVVFGSYITTQFHKDEDIEPLEFFLSFLEHKPKLELCARFVKNSVDKLMHEFSDSKDHPEIGAYYAPPMRKLNAAVKEWNLFTNEISKPNGIDAPDIRVKKLVDWYYALHKNTPPEAKNGKRNAGGRIAKAFQELLSARDKENGGGESSVQRIKELYESYVNEKEKLVHRDYKWLFNCPRSVVDFQGKYAHIENYAKAGKAAMGRVLSGPRVKGKYSSLKAF